MCARSLLPPINASSMVLTANSTFRAMGRGWAEPGSGILRKMYWQSGRTTSSIGNVRTTGQQSIAGQPDGTAEQATDPGVFTISRTGTTGNLYYGRARGNGGHVHCPLPLIRMSSDATLGVPECRCTPTGQRRPGQR